jgi:hypothetical protein
MGVTAAFLLGCMVGMLLAFLYVLAQSERIDGEWQQVELLHNDLGKETNGC